MGDGGERAHIHVVEDRGKDQVVEVLAHAVLDVVEAELLGVELIDALATVLVDEADAALVVAAAAADADELEQRGALVQDLEGAVEEVAGVDGAGVDLQHLLHVADAKDVGGTKERALGHDVDAGLVGVLLGPLGSERTGVLDGLAIDGVDQVEGGHSGLVLGIALGLLRKLHGDHSHDGRVGAAHAGLVDGQAVVLDLVVADLGEAGLVNIDGDGAGAVVLGDLGGNDGLLGAAHGHDDGQGVLVDVGRGGVHELVAGVAGAHDLRGLVLHKVLGRIVTAVGSAGANPHDALDAALVCLVSQNLGDDVLNLFLSSHRASAFLLV